VLQQKGWGDFTKGKKKTGAPGLTRGKVGFDSGGQRDKKKGDQRGRKGKTARKLMESRGQTIVKNPEKKT